MSKQFLTLAFSILIISVSSRLFSRSVAYAQEPPEYQWHTFIGSNGIDPIQIRVDNESNIYLIGSSENTWDGPDNATPLNPYTAAGDIVVVKLDKNGVYQWHTFLGGDGDDRGFSVDVDSDGNIYLVGHSVAWDGPNGAAPLHPYQGEYYDIVVVKLNSSGVYQWHTFYGSAISDLGLNSKLDASGNIYLSGTSAAGWVGPDGTLPVAPHTNGSNQVILKLDRHGTYQWHTFLYPGSPPYTTPLDLDESGNIYITGITNAWNGPDNNTSPLHPYSGGFNDIIVVKLNNNGVYQWHTFYGSSSFDEYDISWAIRVDSNNNVYVTGLSGAWNGPSDTAPLNLHNGKSDVVLVKLNSNGAYQWHTFYGGGGNDSGNGLDLDSNDNIYITGGSGTTWNGPDDTAPLVPYTNKNDVIAMKLNSAGAYQWHTFYGGSGYEGGAALDLDSNDNIYITGNSSDTWNGPGDTLPLNLFTDTMHNTLVLKLGQIVPNPEPDIQVQGGNISIPNGDTTPSPTDGTDFGEILAASHGLTHTFTIINNGNVELTVGSVSLSGDTSNFSVVSQPVNSITADGGSTTFTLRFAPTDSGLYTATVSLSHNAPDPNPYTFIIQGTGLEPPMMSGAVVYLPVIIKSCCQ